MPAAAAQQKRLRKGAQGVGLRYGAQMGGPVGKGRYANQMRGPGGPAAAVMPQRGRMDSRLGEMMQAKRAGMEKLPRAGGGQPEMDIGVQSPAVMPPDAAAKPIPTGGSGKSADVGTGGTGPIDMGPTPKGVQDAGAGGGGRVVRPGTGLIQPPAAPAAAPVTPLAGEIQRGPGGVATGQPAAMLSGAPGLMRQRQPLSGFRPQAKKKTGSRFFTGA